MTSTDTSNNTTSNIGNPLDDHDYCNPDKKELQEPRARRPRDHTSVTDKSQWIMGEDQLDSALSEQLNDEPSTAKRQRIPKELDPAYVHGESSEYSVSDAEQDQASDDYDSDDDPNKLWCTCRRPHENKFMIQCDTCQDWFHGQCVGVTKLMGDRFEKEGREWHCLECVDKIRSGIPRSAIAKKREKKEKNKSKSLPGKRGRGRPRKSETLVATRTSQRTRKSTSAIEIKSVDRLKRNISRPSESRIESFYEYDDPKRLKELIKEKKREFFQKRRLIEQQNAAKRTELGLGRQSLTASLSGGLNSLASSTSTPNQDNLPIKKEASSECWSGKILMPEVAKFSALAKTVSGSMGFVQDEIDRDLIVCGRIAPDQVLGYIKKLKATTKNQIDAIQIFPSTEEDRSNFEIFFNYLYRRNRYAVIKTTQNALKDFYVVPVHENSSIPDILKPIQGSGLDRSGPNCLLGLLVRTKKS